MTTKLQDELTKNNNYKLQTDLNNPIANEPHNEHIKDTPT